MESIITGTVGEVTGRETSKGVIHDIFIGTQKVSAWSDSGLGEEAKALQGSTVEAVVDITTTQKNDRTYKNYNLKSLKLTDAVSATSTIPVEPAKKGWSDEDTARVTKLSCFSTAFAYCSQMGESEDAALALSKRLYELAMGTATQEQEPVAVGAEPATVDEDIPW